MWKTFVGSNNCLNEDQWKKLARQSEGTVSQVDTGIMQTNLPDLFYLDQSVALFCTPYLRKIW